MKVEEILQAVASGAMSVDEARIALAAPKSDELGFATVDIDRARRRGRPEAIYCAGKTAEQIAAITHSLANANQNVILTRLDKEKAADVARILNDVRFVYTDVANLATLVVKPTQKKQAIVAVLAAGTSDLSVAEEAALVAEVYGCTVERAYDVGVAGVHRLLAKQELLQKARVVIAVAGMEGALPSVAAGLTAAPVIAVPTSVGYGVSANGYAATLTMLATCSPGIAVVNIDNGFGAGYLADQICTDPAK